MPVYPSIPTCHVVEWGTYAKKRILIARARPACNPTTKISKILEVFMSVALRTGYLYYISVYNQQLKETWG